MEKELGWALVGTGHIVEKFAAGLRLAEGVGSVCVVSRSEERAQAFAQAHGLRKGYGSLEAALADSQVDLVYVGSPHSAHMPQAEQALRAKKAVLCEKPLCLSAVEASRMIKTAQENQTLLMEAMWNRFMPAMGKVRSWLAEGQLGEVRRVEATFGFPTAGSPEGRMLNLALGGGALLDMGVYPVSFASMVFGGEQPKEIRGMMFLGKTGVDEETMALLDYGQGRMACLQTSISSRMTNDAWIYGSLGAIHMPDFVFGRTATLHMHGRFSHTYAPDVRGHGYVYEAEEAMACLRQGKLESPGMTLAESLVVMEIMDEIRRQGGLQYPGEALHSVNG